MDDAERQAVRRKLITQTILWIAITGVILFAAAGTLRWPEAWIYLGLWLIFGLASGLSLARENPDILKERMRSPLQKSQKSWDRPVLMAIFAGWAIFQIVAGLDAGRYHLSNMPLWLEVIGGIAFIFAIYLSHIVMRENTYASTIVKVDTERGHKVIDTGPYAWVRHPMYTGAIFYFLGAALLLGSWYAFAVGIAVIALLALRATWEEQTLATELAGYADYAQRVKYRLVPGVW